MTERSYNELTGLARMCARQARLSTANNMAQQLWNIAVEYQQEAAGLADGKLPDIGRPPPFENSMTTNAGLQKVPRESNALADEYGPIGIRCVVAAGGWNRKTEQVLGSARTENQYLEPAGEIPTMDEEDRAKRFADRTTKVTQDTAATAAGEIPTMNEEDRAKRFADRTAKATQDTAASGARSAEKTVRGLEQSYSDAFDNLRSLNVRLIDAAQANADAACALARDIATIKTPSDLLSVWMNHAQKQFDMATKQANDLTALGQKLANESTARMTRNFQQAYAQATT